MQHDIIHTIAGHVDNAKTFQLSRTKSLTHVACEFTGSFYSSCSSNSRFEELGDKETPIFFWYVANKRLEKAKFLALFWFLQMTRSFLCFFGSENKDKKE
jgi:hypothetical protein